MPFENRGAIFLWTYELDTPNAESAPEVGEMNPIRITSVVWAGAFGDMADTNAHTAPTVSVLRLVDDAWSSCGAACEHRL